MKYAIVWMEILKYGLILKGREVKGDKDNEKKYMGPVLVKCSIIYLGRH
jgi:hypothetical protein